MQLTERDLEIVRFILNMKFASVEDVHRKFFKYRRDGGISTSEWYARERLRGLLESGYIRTERYRFENKIYYLGSKLGYRLVEYSICADVTAKPIDRIDIKTFEHDQKVMQCRLLLEEHEKVRNWQSDRQLKSSYGDYFLKANRDTAPDGIYTSVSGKSVAFEFEISQKSKKRYVDKIRKYIFAMRESSKSDRPKFDHVQIICEKESVRNILMKEARLYKEFFNIELAVEFFDKFKSDQALISMDNIIPLIIQ